MKDTHVGFKRVRRGDKYYYVPCDLSPEEEEKKIQALKDKWGIVD